MVTDGHGEGQMDTEMDTVEAMRARLAFRDEVPGTFCDSCVHWEDMAWRQREQLKTARNAALEEAAIQCDIVRKLAMHGVKPTDKWSLGRCDAGEYLGKAIRALKT